MLAVLEMLEEENKKIYRKGRRDGEKVGKEAGRIAGKEEGKREGKKEANLETAKKLLEAKIPMKIIIEATGLKENEISKLRKN